MHISEVVYIKRYGNLWGQITSMDNIKAAHIRARKGKALKAAEVDADLDNHLQGIQNMLLNKTFRSSEYRFFTKKDNGKIREIADLPYYPDRIVHWALIRVLEPLFLKTFISQTYAALPNKGTHACLNQLHEYFRDVEGTKYCLKLDVRKYFPSMDKEILKAKFRTFIKDEDTLWLIDRIIDDYPKSGIPIGNYTSQYFGNFYLSEFDHYVKEELGIKYYLRYMDDIVILCDNKRQLWEWKDKIDTHMKDELHATLKDNAQVFPVESRGVDFVGYRSFHDYALLRTRTKKKLKRRCRYLLKKQEKGEPFNETDLGVIASYNGILMYGDCYRLRQETLAKIKS